LALSESKKSKRDAKGPSATGGDGKVGDRDVGHALRSVYAKTVSEDIPSELLDLLGKLS
jgi:Anti-sigma factor NepR